MTRASILLTSLLFAFAACKKGEEAKKDEPAKADDKKEEAKGEGSGDTVGAPPALKTGEGAGTGNPIAAVEAKVDQAAAVLKEGEALTKEKYEELIVALASCKVIDTDIDAECPAAKALQDAMNRSQTLADLAGMSADLGRKLIGHEAPAVRLKAAGMMASFLGTEGASQEAIIEQAKKETDLGVLRAMIRTVANDGARNSKVGELLLWAADHADASVRLQGVYALSSPWNRELKGGAEKLAGMMELDADPKVRQAACEYAGNLGDDKLIKSYERLTKDSGDGDLYGACFSGVVAMWASYPLWENHSKKAYALTLKLLKAEPRSDKVPPWDAMGTFGYLVKASPEWQKAASFYKAGDLRKALSEVVADRKANWMARTGAVEAIAALGASKKDLEKLRKEYGDKPEMDDSHVAKKLDEAIATAP